MPTIEHIPTIDGTLAPERKLDVTASDVPALFGAHFWKTTYGLFREKIGAAEISEQESAFLERGHDVEPIVLAKFTKDNPKWCVWPAKEYLRDPDHHLGATPDAYAEDSDKKFVVLEIKTISSFEMKRGRWTEASPPESVLLQTLTQMHLAAADYGLVLAFDLDRWKLMPPYRVDRYLEVENEIEARAQKFMEAVRDGHEPGPDFARDGALIAARYLKTERKEIDLRGDNRMGELCQQYLDVSAVLRKFQDRRSEVAAEIASKIEDAEVALVNGYKLTNKLIHRRAHQVAESSYRKLSISEEDGE